MSPQRHDYEIIRFKQSDYMTWGRIFDANGFELGVIMELPFIDADNNGTRDPNVSRFQHGLYRCFLRKSHKNGGTGKRDHDVWQFEDVPDIVAAQLHMAKWPWHLEGCCAIGTAFGEPLYLGETVSDGRYPRVKGRSYPGITGSKLAFEKFMKDSLALCAREGREHIWIRVVDRFGATPGTFA